MSVSGLNGNGTPAIVLSQILSSYSHPEKAEIANAVVVEQIIQDLVNDGPSKLQVIADFDMTLTRFHENGVRCESCSGVLDYSPLMPPDLKRKNDALRQKYYPIEIDPSTSMEEKIPLMIEWYQSSNANLVRAGITKPLLKDVVAQSRAILRDAVPLLVKMLNKAQVPLLIFSAGIGNVVEAVLEKNELVADNMKVISNYMIFDDNETLVGFKEPMIHMFNKNESHLHHADYFAKIAHRQNAILLGDSLGDLQMSAGVKTNNNAGKILRIGFLNDKIPERLELFKKSFDIVLVDDQSMEFANLLLKATLGT